jgi:hypothetical protein
MAHTAPDDRQHHIPNLVAVTFYREGDLLRAVDTLNGVK